ncbi:restriction endonuclease subunit S [Haloarcula rubripromontorii]|uniref:restriction endonuclease subunit S n=1 Tax=Haloarcula rubripromontorii TaxID=1705562 RepID=UPI00097BFF50|nr:restriction endonuclease subunit S [Haloarcula rubripromontorii]
MIEKDELPTNWNLKTLGEIAEFQNGNDFSKSQWEEEGKPIIRIQNLTGTGDSYNYFSGEVDNRYKVEKGDILFAWSGTIDAFRWYGEDAWLNQHIYKVTQSQDVTEDYLYNLLKHSARILERKKVGSGLQHIRKSHVEELDVPVPPLDEQERIVEAVEERLERVERLEKSVENVGRLADEYQDSFTISLFAGLDNLRDNVDIQNLSDSIPDEWEMKNFGEVIQSSLYGCNPETGEDIDGVPYLRISDIREDGGLKYSELPEKAKFEDDSGAEKYSLNNGDIVIARTGGRLCGKSYVYEPRHGDMVYASYLIRFKLNTNKVAKEYIKAYLQSPIYWRQVWSGKKPSTSTRQNINAGEIKSFKIPVPPIEKQQDIVNSLRETDYSSIQRASDDLSHLFNEYRESVLASAFGGKIDY